MKNIAQSLIQILDGQGKLPAYAWPGGYPVYYLDSDNMVLCPDCANRCDEYTSAIVTFGSNYEDDNLYCEDCGCRIEAAYED